jgi:hypothetical protein
LRPAPANKFAVYRCAEIKKAEQGYISNKKKKLIFEPVFSPLALKIKRLIKNKNSENKQIS